MKRRTGGKLATAIILMNKNNVSLPIMKLFIRVVDLPISHIRVIYITYIASKQQPQRWTAHGC
jgi:hypothetical protein